MKVVSAGVHLSLASGLVRAFDLLGLRKGIDVRPKAGLPAAFSAPKPRHHAGLHDRCVGQIKDLDPRQPGEHLPDSFGCPELLMRELRVHVQVSLDRQHLSGFLLCQVQIHLAPLLDRG